MGSYSMYAFYPGLLMLFKAVVYFTAVYSALYLSDLSVHFPVWGPCISFSVSLL